MTFYDEKLSACPLCGSSSTAQKYSIERFSPPFDISRCRDCGFLFMNPPFSDEKIASFYTEGYYGGAASYSYIDERKLRDANKIVWKKRIEVLHKYVRGGNFLDVGAAFGGLMETAGLFYRPFGIELSRHAGEYAAAVPGATVHIGTLEDRCFAPDFFSAITMIELIEHLKNPAAALKECFRLLKKDGVLVIQTANMEGLQARILGDKYAYFLPGHLSYFSKRNLTQALINTGFRRVKAFIPVEFGLLPKLRKTAASRSSLPELWKLLRISLYHMAGKLHFGNFCPTSSMVLYAFK